MRKIFFSGYVILFFATGCVQSQALFEKHVIEAYGNPEHGWRRATGGIIENPVVADERSIENGRKLYQQHCAMCHGSEGLGNGPSAASLKPKPANLQEAIRKKGDYHVFLQIEGGREGMPVWAESLKERDIWDLVNHVKTLR